MGEPWPGEHLTGNAAGQRAAAHWLTETEAPVWAGERDADALEGSAPEPLPEQHKDHIANRLLAGWWRDPHAVERRLGEGDEVGSGFEVIDFPGHTPSSRPS